MIRKKVNLGKLSPLVRRLYEEALIRGLEKDYYILAHILKVTPRQLYRWFSGDQPRANSEQLILEAIDRLNKEMPMEEISEKRSAYRAPRIAAEADALRVKKAGIKLNVLFEELQKRCSQSEREILHKSWQDFVEVLALCRRYGAKIPRNIS